MTRWIGSAGMIMDDAATDGAAFAETVVFLRHFRDLWDPRQCGKVIYPLDKVLLLCLLGVLAGAECFAEIALFGAKKLALLRRFCLFKHDVNWLQQRHDWPGLKGVAMVESSREISGKIERETRYYITSMVMAAALLEPVIRSHWAIENSLHLVMDMMFRDDESRVPTDHAPANFTTVKHMALNLLRRPPGKQSLRGRRKAASWDDDFLARFSFSLRRFASDVG